jgi:hypothetical protein
VLPDPRLRHAALALDTGQLLGIMGTSPDLGGGTGIACGQPRFKALGLVRWGVRGDREGHPELEPGQICIGPVTGMPAP